MDPVGYLDMVRLEQNARVIITDSGGVQKEAFFYGVPCITLRQETEWMELVELGCNRLVNTDAQAIVQAVEEMTAAVPLVPGGDEVYGNGEAGKLILGILLSHTEG
jgi:UDP-GlcNAc3NAcA epimerase